MAFIISFSFLKNNLFIIAAELKQRERGKQEDTVGTKCTLSEATFEGIHFITESKLKFITEGKLKFTSV